MRDADTAHLHRSCAPRIRTRCLSMMGGDNLREAMAGERLLLPVGRQDACPQRRRINPRGREWVFQRGLDVCERGCRGLARRQFSGQGLVGIGG